MMGSRNTLHILTFILLCSHSLAFSTESEEASGELIMTTTRMVKTRQLLQTRTPCPVDFGAENYTSITSVCKSPYPREPCCSAFVNFTCRFIVPFNDNTTDCADQMFAYLNNAGNYPGGLFANLCVEGPEGLLCPSAPAPSAPSSAFNSKAAMRTFYLLNLFMFIIIFFIGFN